MAEGRKLNTVETVNTLAASDRLVTVRTADGHTVQISLTDFMSDLISSLISEAVIPAAWGLVSSSGIVTNNGSVDLVVNKTGTGEYVITGPGTVKGLSAVPATGNFGRIVSFSGSPLTVNMWDVSGNRVDTGFWFIAYLQQ